MMSSIRLPFEIYATPAGVKSSEDMCYGDLSAQQLQEIYSLKDISTKVNTYSLTKIDSVPQFPGINSHPFDRTASLLLNAFNQSPNGFGKPSSTHLKLSKEECASVLFDEFRNLSAPFALYGPYRGLIVKMIDHMQGNSGSDFSDHLLNRALNDQIRHDNSGDSSLKNIKSALFNIIDWERKVVDYEKSVLLNQSVMKSILPKFQRTKDSFNGMAITIHDTFATQITLKSLSISDNGFTACINYKVQDHFGLDTQDILNPTFNALRFFRIWFVLQHWEMFGYRPFVTKMETDVFISGGKR